MVFFKVKRLILPGSPARQSVCNDYYGDIKWAPFRALYIKKFSFDKIKGFLNEFYKFCKEENEVFSFILWFINTHIKHYINIIRKRLSIDDRGN